MQRIQGLLQPPNFDDEGKQWTANIQHFLLVVLMLATSLLLVITWMMQFFSWGIAALICLFVFLGCFWLVRLGHIRLVGYIIPLVLTGVTTFLIIAEGQRLHDYTILLYPLAILLSGLFLGRKAPLIHGLIISACILVIYIAEQNEWIAAGLFVPITLYDVLIFTVYIMMLGLLVDIAIHIINTSLKQRQDLNIRIQQNETNYRLLFEEAPDAIIITNSNGIIQMVNPGVLKMLEFTEQEIVGKPLQTLIAPEDLTPRSANLFPSSTQNHQLRRERLLVCKNGVRLHVLTSSKMLPDGRYQFLATDISDRIRSEQTTRSLNRELEQRVQARTQELEAAKIDLETELEKRQHVEASLRIMLTHTEALYQITHTIIAQDDLHNLLTAIVDNMVHSISAHEGLLITFDIENQKVLQFVRSGVGLEDTSNVSYQELWDGLSGWVMRELKPALSPKGIPDLRESEKARQRRAADKRGSIIVVPLHYRGKTLGTLTAMNRPDQPDFTTADVDLMAAIANQVSIAIENARLFANLQQRTHHLENTNQELASFAYSVSHDLRAPLRSIQNFSQIFKEDYAHKLETEELEYLNRIISATQRMNDLIDSLLKLSRLTSTEILRTQINLSAMVTETLETLRKNEPDRKITTHIAPLITALADYKLVKNVIVNLLDNAWKYTAKTKLAHIEFGVQIIEDETVYFIRDNGAGFDLRYADKLFSPFQRLHNHKEFPGHGIGLATVQRIIHRHGGKIWAESKPEQGATFYFTLGNQQSI